MARSLTHFSRAPGSRPTIGPKKYAYYDLWSTPTINIDGVFDSIDDTTAVTPTISDSSSPLSDDSTPDLSSCSDQSALSGTDELSVDSDDLDFSLPSMEAIVPRRRLDLPPSCFQSGCICGHQFEFRDMVYISRKKNTRSPGVTIRPRVAPITARLRRKELLGRE